MTNIHKHKKINLLRGEYSDQSFSVIKRSQRPMTGKTVAPKFDKSMISGYDMHEKLDMVVFEAAGSTRIIPDTTDTDPNKSL